MQGFVITLVLMALGVVVILLGVFGALYGIACDTKVVSVLAGVVTEVISGSTLLVYRLNFNRLNHVSDRLEEICGFLLRQQASRLAPAGEAG